MNKKLSLPTPKREPLELESPQVLSTIIWLLCGLLIVIALLPLLARR